MTQEKESPHNLEILDVYEGNKPFYSNIINIGLDVCIGIILIVLGSNFILGYLYSE